MLFRSPKTFAAYYQGFLGGKLFRWLDFMKLRVIKRALGRSAGPLQLVDLGCGTGNISRRVHSACPQVTITCVDHDDRLLAMATRGDFQTVAADFNRTLPFADASFDVVLMVDTIEHVASRSATLNEATRILRDTGSLIVFTPPYDSIRWLLGEMFFRIVTRRPLEHISPFTNESLTWSLATRFEDWQVDYTNFGLTLWGVGSRKRKP